MKNFKTMLFFFLAIGISANAKTTNTPENNSYNNYDGKAYIFVEGSVEFSVFPDGQFDFVYVGPQNGTEVIISTPNVNLSFNGGHDYEAYVQYDDYGAIIQVEDVEVYYDEYGRISQAGNVDISYRNRRIVRVGGLHINYNSYGYYDYTTGYINPYNRIYVFRPWHSFYIRPIYSNCIVWDVPYRRYYTPLRYSYYHHVGYYNNRNVTPYHNSRRDFYRPGSRVHYQNGRTAVNRNYREGRTNTMVNSHGRRTNTAVANTNSRNNARATTSRNSSRSVNRQENTTRVNSRGTVARNIRATTTRPSTIRSDRGTTTRPSTNKVDRSRNNTQRTVASNNTPRVAKQRATSTSRPKTTTPKRSTRTTSSSNRNSSTARSTRSTSTSRSNSKTATPKRGRSL